MIRFNLIKLISFLILILTLAENVAARQVPKQDTVSLQQIQIPHASLKKFKENKSFRYVRVKAAPGVIDRFLMMLREWFGYRFIANMAPWAFYSMLVLAFIVVIIVLFRSNFQGVFVRNSYDTGLNISQSEIDNGFNFEQLLSEALRANNYNLAVRYLYLIVLRRLNQKNIITYRTGKTNFEYLNEIKNSSIVPLFRAATHNYEYAWYGQFPIDENEYRVIEEDYKNLTAKLDD